MRTSFSNPPLSVAHEAAYSVRPQYAGRYGTNGVVAGTPGMDADLVGRDRVEDARPTDLDGEAGGELTHLLKVEARRIAVINVAKDADRGVKAHAKCFTRRRN